MELNRYIDHTVLKATTTNKDIILLCDEAKKWGFFSVCVNGSYTSLAKKELSGSDVKVCSVIGFPLGAMDTHSKVYEAKTCVDNGADEIDMVLNVGYLKSGMTKEVEEEIREIKKVLGNKVLKVILGNLLFNKG
jgi:deoxyribose-phosphate aldolase